MAATLLTAGIACIIAAIVGGGLKAFGIEIPVLDSGRRQAALGAFGVLLLAAGPALNGFRVPSDTPEGSTGACSAAWFSSQPPDRVVAMESGAADFEVLTSDKPKDRPVVVVLTEGGQRVGAVAFDFYASNELFKISEVVDAECTPVDRFRNESRGGDKRVLQNWDTVEMTLGNTTYALRLGYASGGISATLRRVG
jgi:hypothetical protein